MLVCLCPMTGLSSGINVIKNFSLLARIVACLLKAFAPVRIFYDDINFRINFLCRLDYQIFRNLQHFCQTELRPGTIALLADTILAHTLGKEKVIDNKLIKK